MNPRIPLRRFVAAILALGVAAVLFLWGPKPASAEEITVIAPFSFSVDNQQYPAGTYRLGLRSGWILSIHNADGKENFFPVRPEPARPSGSRGRLTFRDREGQKKLQAVY